MMISQRRKDNYVASKGGRLHHGAKTFCTITHGRPEKPSNAPDVTRTVHKDEPHPNSPRHVYSSSSSSTIGSISHFEMKMKRMKKKTSKTKTTAKQIGTSQNNNREKIRADQQMSKIIFGDTDRVSTTPSNNMITDKHAEQATWSRTHSHHQRPTHMNNSPESVCDVENISEYTHLTRHKTANTIQRSSHEIWDKHKPDFTAEYHKSIMNEMPPNKFKNSFPTTFVETGKYNIKSTTKEHPITKLKISGTSKAEFDHQKKGSRPSAKNLNMYNNIERRLSQSTNAGPHDNNKIDAYNPYNVSPGPAMYNMPSFLGRGVPHKPSAGAAIILGRHSTVVEQANSPGPCYSAVPLNIYKKKQPEYSISTKNTTSKHKTNSPGPGAYCPTNSYTSNYVKGISFGQRHSIYRKTVYTNDDLL